MNMVQQAVASMQLNDSGKQSQTNGMQASEDSNFMTSYFPNNATSQLSGICQHCGNHCGHTVATTPSSEPLLPAQPHPRTKRHRRRRMRREKSKLHSLELTYVITLSSIPITNIETIPALSATTLPILLKTIKDKYPQHDKLNVHEIRKRIEGLILETGDGEQFRVGFDNVKAEKRYGRCEREYNHWFDRYGKGGDREILRLEICLVDLDSEMNGSKADTSTKYGLIGSKEGGEAANVNEDEGAKWDVVGSSDVMSVDWMS